MKTIEYKGGHLDGVYIPLPDGTEIVAVPGEPVEVPDDIAKGLLDQPDNWAAVKSHAAPKKDEK